MLTEDERLRPREEEVAAKVMDGEAIIINLANGTYYSMDNVGGFVWELLQQGPTVREIGIALSERYEVSPEEAQRDVERLLADLLKENLIGLDGQEPVERPVVESGEARLPYAKPTLNVYRDMGDLLALDPPTPGLDSPWKDSGQAEE
jgi:hypothetical protein